MRRNHYSNHFVNIGKYLGLFFPLALLYFLNMFFVQKENLSKDFAIKNPHINIEWYFTILPIIFVFICLVGCIITIVHYLKLEKTERRISKDIIIITEFGNENHKYISYFLTFVIPLGAPFFPAVFSLIIIGASIIMLFPIYLKSDWIILNPALFFLYSLYDIDYSNAESQGKTYKGKLLLKKAHLERGDHVAVRRESYNLFHGIIIKQYGE